jgi:hypothetical protein
MIASTDLILKTLKNNQLVTVNCEDAEIIGLPVIFFSLTLATSHLVRDPIFNNNMEDPGVRSSTELTFAMSRVKALFLSGTDRLRSSSPDVFYLRRGRALPLLHAFRLQIAGFRHLQLQLNYTCKQT